MTICPMALHKFSKSKAFHVDYCGCTAAALLLNESSIRDAIHLVRKVKSKHEYVRTTMVLAKDGIEITYENEQKYSTNVPSSMIGGATNGKSSLHDTVGVVYISPLTGRHYPAFVHVYRCDSSRTAQKLLARLRTYTHMENHRSEILQIERQLLDRNLLNLDHYNATKSQSQSLNTIVLNSNQTNTGVSSSSTSSNGRHDPKIDPVKSITEEFQKKIDSQQPLLFPPKDYDAVHAGHGNIRKAQAWKSTEPTIVGYTPDPARIQRPVHTNNRPFNHTSDNDGLKKPETRNDLIESNERPRFRTQSSDMTIDPVETVSLAFEFLKDETGSMTTEHDGDLEHLDTEEQDHSPIYRFRPPQVTATPKKLYTRNNHHDLSTGLPQPYTSVKNDLNSYYNHTHHQQQQQRVPTGHRTRSETNLYYDPQPAIHLSPRYGSRVVNRSVGPIPTNPLWTTPSPTLIGSQPNLLSHQETNGQVLFHRHLSPLNKRQMTSVPLQHPLYASYPINKPSVIVQQQENQQKRLGSAPPASHSDKRYPAKPQYLDTNEFILRASNGQLLKNSQYLDHPTKDMSRDYTSQSMNVNGNSNTMLDVYY